MSPSRCLAKVPWLMVAWSCLPFSATAAFPPTVTLPQIRDAIERVPSGHPRLLVHRDELSSLKSNLPPDSLRRTVADHIVRQAEALLPVAPVTRALQGRRLLGQSRRCLERVLVLATAFHVTGEARFAARAEKEMLAAAAFSDWNPNHFLDVAEMTLALAVGYDWLFEHIDPASREIIRAALVEKSLRLPFETRHRNWVRARNNWGQVCHGGLTAGALAILEDEPDLAARIVHQAVMNVPLSMEAYAPRGSYPEGPSYWAYGTTYNVFLIALLQRVLGTDFGLSEAPGFNVTGQYPALMTGPSGETFNYADGGSGRGPEPVLFWFARHYQRSDWLRGEFDILRDKLPHGGRFLPLALLWMDESMPASKVRMPLHWFGEGPVPVSVHRSSWDDEHRVFVGLKGGSPSANHGQMDIGSFVLDADGVRWALDLGAEGYHGIESRGMNLWSSAQDSDRWTIFRQMNHGHNTLVIDDQLQRAAGFGRYEKFSDDPAFPHSVIDMSSVYEGQAQSARRGVALLPGGCVLIRDELAGMRPGAEVRWGMVTRATAGAAGATRMELSHDQAGLSLRILAPAQVAWQTADLARPRREWDSPNPGATMIHFVAIAPANGALSLSVLAQPGTAQSPADERLLERPLDRWP